MSYRIRLVHHQGAYQVHHDYGDLPDGEWYISGHYDPDPAHSSPVAIQFSAPAAGGHVSAPAPLASGGSGSGSSGSGAGGAGGAGGSTSFAHGGHVGPGGSGSSYSGSGGPGGSGHSGHTHPHASGKPGFEDVPEPVRRTPDEGEAKQPGWSPRAPWE